MPKQNMDNIFKDKLKGIESPYNDADWKQMEAMLDGKGKKPFAYWWWGTALILLLSGGFAFYQFGLGNGSDITDQAITEQEIYNEATTNVSNESPDVVKASSSKQEAEITNNSTKVGNNTGENGTIATPGKSTIEPPSNLLAANIIGKNNNNKGTIVISRIPQDSVLLDKEYINRLDNAGYFGIWAIPCATSMKYRKMRFSIAAESALYQSFMKTATITKPGYSAGLSFEFLFKNRVGLHTGLRYTQWRYKVDEPLFDSDEGPVSFTSTLRAVEIPIGIRVIAVQKHKWNFYLSTGISNIFIIDERFDYTFNDVIIDTIIGGNPTTTNNFNTTSLPVGFNSTNNIGSESALFDSQFQSASSSGTQTVTKRYIASYYVSAGFEHHFGGRYSWQIEPGYSMTLNKVGLVDKRMHTASLYTRLRVYFGR